MFEKLPHECPKISKFQIKSRLFLNFTVVVRQITLIPSTTSFSCFSSFSSLYKHTEKSDHNSHARGRPGPGELHDDRVASELGPFFAHLPALVTLQRSQRLDICPRRRPEVVVGDTRQVAHVIQLRFLAFLWEIKVWDESLARPNVILATVSFLSEVFTITEVRKGCLTIDTRKRKEKPTIWLC